MELEQVLQGFFPGNGRSVRRLRRELLSSLHRRSPIVIAGERGTGKDHTARIIHHLLTGPDTPFFKLTPGDALPTGPDCPPQEGRFTLYLDGGEEPFDGHERLIEEYLECVADRGHLILSLTTPFGDDECRPLLPSCLSDACPVVRLPSLRHRREDLPLLMGQLCLTHENIPSMCLELADLHFLYTHPWPGNLGELWSWMEGKVVSTRGDGGEPAASPRVALGKVMDREIDAWVGQLLEHSTRTTGLLKKVVGKVERCVLKAVLDRSGGRQVESARILGINRNTLAHKIREHGLTAHSHRKAKQSEEEPKRSSSRRRS